jgi:hypothetical protein
MFFSAKFLAPMASAPAWSRGGRIAFTYGSSPGVRLVGARGSPRHRVGPGAAPAWSPNGRTLAVVRNGEIWCPIRAGDIAAGSCARRPKSVSCRSGRRTAGSLRARAATAFASFVQFARRGRVTSATGSPAAAATTSAARRLRGRGTAGG